MHKKIFALMGILLILAVNVIPAAAITWGWPDNGSYPNVGAMVVDWPDYGPWQLCSGTLIHPRVFLTAGHCTDGLVEEGIDTIWVNFDAYALNPDTLLPVEKVITHPDFAFGSNNFHDVGLLILAEPVTDISPAELPIEDFLSGLKKSGDLRNGPNGAKFTVVGYGGTLAWPPPDIYYEDIRQVSVSEYVALVEAQLHLSQNINKGDGGTCFGDSGGPVFYTDIEGKTTLVGITSWGDAQCVATGFYYRTDIPETLDFIEDVIASLE